MAMFNSKLYDLKPFSSAGSNIIQHPTIAGPRKVFGGSEDFHKKTCPFWGWFYMYPTRTRILCIYIYIYIYVYIYIQMCVFLVYVYIYINNSIYPTVGLRISRIKYLRQSSEAGSAASS